MEAWQRIEAAVRQLEEPTAAMTWSTQQYKHVSADNYLETNKQK